VTKLLSGKELKAFRNRRKLSLRDIAGYANMSISTISEIENGKVKVNEKNHKAITNGINKAYAERVYAKFETENNADSEPDKVESENKVIE
jgi:transcriptional regulator with XRE-family HTH domain